MAKKNVVRRQTTNNDNDKEKIYEEFTKRFPNFGNQVKRYFKYGQRGLKIYTVQGGKFIFELSEDGDDFNLRAC